MNELIVKHCLPCEGKIPPLSHDTVEKLLSQLSHWTMNENRDEISRTFQFKNYYHTMAFVNAIAWMAHKENHHPLITLSYNTCLVSYTTHAIHGLTENDFICASKVDALFLGQM